MDNHSIIFSKVMERTKLGDEMKTLTTELIEIKKRRLLRWPELRVETSSDKQADNIWEATPDGIRAMELKYLIDALKNRRSDLKLEIDVLRDEARSVY